MSENALESNDKTKKNVYFEQNNNNQENVISRGDKKNQQQSDLLSSTLIQAGPKNIGVNGRSERKFTYGLKSGLATGSVKLQRRQSFLLNGKICASNAKEKREDFEPRLSGFIDGNFSSGKVFDLEVDQCFVMAYQNLESNDNYNDEIFPSENVSLSLLAVGTVKTIAFYETLTYTLVHETYRSGMVSAIKWLPALPMYSKSSKYTYESSTTAIKPWLLVVGGLDGIVSLYSVDTNILESQGPTLLYEFKVGGEVRSLDGNFFGKLDPKTLGIFVGDKSGKITFSSFQCNTSGSDIITASTLQHIDTVIERQYDTGVLGLTVSRENGLLAACTKGGEVFVYKLHRQHTGTVYIEQHVWDTKRNGPIRCVVFSRDGLHLSFGGYDKIVTFVETNLWAESRQLHLSSTINVISFDPKGRYLGVGCRDKSFTLFDTSTYVPVKTFHVSSWVTSISWGPSTRDDMYSCQGRDLVAIRSDNNCISVLDLTPTCHTKIRLSAHAGEESSTSWSTDGTLIARVLGNKLAIADSLDDYNDVLQYEMEDSVAKVAFCHSVGKENLLAAIDNSGMLILLHIQFDQSAKLIVGEMKSVFATPYLKALAWSDDGSMIATGGKDNCLYIYNAHNLQRKIEPIVLKGRIWDIEFVPALMSETAGARLLLGVALGDYTTIILNVNFEPVLQIGRSRACRCLSFNPTRQVMAIGDGAGTVAIVDYNDEELIKEFDVRDRVNTLKYSPSGDFLVVGTDNSRFSLLETKEYQSLQEITCKGFALNAAFSSNGIYLSLGCASDSYSILRLGPFLGIDLVPLTLDGGIERIPPWALKEALFRSWDGPSLIQRHMITGEHENLRRVADILREYPNAIYTYNRRTNEGSFSTALNQKIPNLLKLVIMTLVDGTLDPKSDSEKNFLTTDIPSSGRDTLLDIVKNYPDEFSVDIFNAISFMKVPFATPKVVATSSRLEKGSASYNDPWVVQPRSGRHLVRTIPTMKLESVSRGEISRTPAVLPLPGLGDMDFLANLLIFAPLEVFDNEAMAIVVRVLWKNHIRKYFILDCIFFAMYYISWVALVELTFSTEDTYYFNEQASASWLALLTALLNTVFAAKEMIQSRMGQRAIYWKSLWNAIDIISIIGVYLYVASILFNRFISIDTIPLTVFTTLLLTTKVLSYLRGFGDTGWLISVLIANFQDVRGFLIILFTILVGFSVTFRLLFGSTNIESFGSLPLALLSTFQLILTSDYDPDMIITAKHRALAVFTFVLAVTCVLVVALNALISILADSYARVQQNAVANRRRELAGLIVEYMSLLTPKKRREIETQTKWFHTLLEVDADGSLQLQTDDWEGGLNALRRDMHEMTESSNGNTQKSIHELKTEIDSELLRFKKDVVSMLNDLHDDVKFLRAEQARGIKLDGRNVVNAVKVVQTVGETFGRKSGAFFKKAEGSAVKSLGVYRGKAISTFHRS